jgi:hypothetical protein
MRGPRLSVAIIAAFEVACGGDVPTTLSIVVPCDQTVELSGASVEIELPSGGTVTVLGESISSGKSLVLDLPASSTPVQLTVRAFSGSNTISPFATGRTVPFQVNPADPPAPLAAIGLADTFHHTTEMDFAGACAQPPFSGDGATATYLPRSGRILLVGGVHLDGGIETYSRLVSAYEISTGRFEVVAQLPRDSARAFHAATLIGDEMVLVTGGENSDGNTHRALNSALIIDGRLPQIHVSDGIPMTEFRTGHTATRLSDGRVLIVGGRSGSVETGYTYLTSIEVWNPTTGRFEMTSASLINARYAHSSVAVAESVAILGGVTQDGSVATVELIRPSVNDFTVTEAATPGSAGSVGIGVSRVDETRVFVSGGLRPERAPWLGEDSAGSIDVAELWRFENGALVRDCTGHMTQARSGHSVEVLQDGRFLISGGLDNAGVPTSTFEAFSFDTAACSTRDVIVGAMGAARRRHASVLIDVTGDVFTVGGQPTAPGQAELFSPMR